MTMRAAIPVAWPEEHAEVEPAPKGLPPSAEPSSPRSLFPGNEEASVRGTLARVFKRDVIRGDGVI